MAQDPEMERAYDEAKPASAQTFQETMMQAAKNIGEQLDKYGRVDVMLGGNLAYVTFRGPEGRAYTWTPADYGRDSETAGHVFPKLPDGWSFSPKEGLCRVVVQEAPQATVVKAKEDYLHSELSTLRKELEDAKNYSSCLEQRLEKTMEMLRVPDRHTMTAALESLRYLSDTVDNFNMTKKTRAEFERHMEVIKTTIQQVKDKRIDR